MKIYKIEIDEKFIDCDCYNAFVIRAKTENNCRLIAAEEAADEGSDVWINPECHTIEYIGETPKRVIQEQIILGSFNAG